MIVRCGGNAIHINATFTCYLTVKKRKTLKSPFLIIANKFLDKTAKKYQYSKI